MGTAQYLLSGWWDSRLNGGNPEGRGDRVKNPHIFFGSSGSSCILRGRIWAPSDLSDSDRYPHSPAATRPDTHLLGRAPRVAASADPPWPGDRASSALALVSHAPVPPGPTAELRGPPRVCAGSSPVAASANESGWVWHRSEPRPLALWLEAPAPPIDCRRGSVGWDGLR